MESSLLQITHCALLLLLPALQSFLGGASMGSCRHKPGARLCEQDQPLPGEGAGIAGGL